MIVLDRLAQLAERLRRQRRAGMIQLIHYTCAWTSGMPSALSQQLADAHEGHGGDAMALRLSQLDGQNGFRIEGIGTSKFSGASVTSARDVNGDVHRRID